MFKCPLKFDFGIVFKFRFENVLQKFGFQTSSKLWFKRFLNISSLKCPSKVRCSSQLWIVIWNSPLHFGLKISFGTRTQKLFRIVVSQCPFNFDLQSSFKTWFKLFLEMSICKCPLRCWFWEFLYISIWKIFELWVLRWSLKFALKV